MILASQCDRPEEAENKNKRCECLVCVDFIYQLVASGYGEVTQERYSVSPLSGKQNGCAIKSAFRRSAGRPSLPAAKPFAHAARP